MKFRKSGSWVGRVFQEVGPEKQKTREPNSTMPYDSNSHINAQIHLPFYLYPQSHYI